MIRFEPEHILRHFNAVRGDLSSMFLWAEVAKENDLRREGIKSADRPSLHPKDWWAAGGVFQQNCKRESCQYNSYITCHLLF